MAGSYDTKVRHSYVSMVSGNKLPNISRMVPERKRGRRLHAPVCKYCTVVAMHGCGTTAYVPYLTSQAHTRTSTVQYSTYCPIPYGFVYGKGTGTVPVPYRTILYSYSLPIRPLKYCTSEGWRSSELEIFLSIYCIDSSSGQVACFVEMDIFQHMPCWQIQPIHRLALTLATSASSSHPITRSIAVQWIYFLQHAQLAYNHQDHI